MALYITLGITLLFVIMMLTGTPMILAGYTCVVLFVITGVMPISQAFAGLTNYNVVMLAGMFTIAHYFGKTSFVKGLVDKILSMKGGSDLKIAAMMFGFTAILAQFIASQTAIIMTMMGFLTGLESDENSEVTVSRMLIPLTFIATLWLGRIPIGSTGVTVPLQINQLLETSGSNVTVDMADLVKGTLVPAIVLLVYSLFTYKWMPKKSVSMSNFGKNMKGPRPEQGGEMSKASEIAVYTAFIVSVIALVMVGKLGDIAFIMPLAIVILLVFLKLLPGREVLGLVTSGPAIICAGFLAISDALQKTGAGELIGTAIINLLGGHPAPIIVLLTFTVGAALLTTFISNTACYMILIPIAVNVAAVISINPKALAVATFFGSLLSIVTPMSSGGAALAYSTAGLSVKDTWKWTVPALLIGIAATVATCYIAFPM